MKRDEEMEKILSGTPVPRVIAGAHRQHLKAQLLEKMEKDGTMVPQMNWTRRASWACGLLLILAVTAWAGQKIFKIYITEHIETGPVTKGVNPDGTKWQKRTSVLKSEAKSDNQRFTDAEAATLSRQCWTLIRAGKATLIKVGKTKDGKKYHLYGVKLPDGKEVEYRLEDGNGVKYLMKQDNPNVASLLKSIYLCKVEKDKDGMLRATSLNFNPNGVLCTIVSYGHSKWEEDPLHEIPTLIAQGKGRVLEIKIYNGRKFYTYEFTLSNGEKVKYASEDKPLEMKK